LKLKEGGKNLFLQIDNCAGRLFLIEWNMLAKGKNITWGGLAMVKILRAIVCFVLGAALLSGFAVNAQGQIPVILDGRALEFDVHPEIIDGRTMVPMRVIFEALGAVVVWDEVNRSITATRGELTVQTTIGDKTMHINGSAMEMDVAPIIVGQRTLVPVRFVSEAFGCDVRWDAAARTVYIDSKGLLGSQSELAMAMANAIQATITMEDGGIIVLELYPGIAPQAVRNFAYLARQGFYDGLRFHRIIKDFMIQGGCPDSLGSGGPGYTIAGEFELNGFANGLEHKRGVLSMARGQGFNSAGSQVFIVHGDSHFLDGAYAAFGRVVSGMEVVDKIAQTPNNGGNGSVALADMPIIKSITIDSSQDLPEPDKLQR